MRLSAGRAARALLHDPVPWHNAHTMQLSPRNLLRRIRPGVPAGTVLALMRAFPVADPRILLGDKPLLVFSPHPDDESLGCGGLIADCRARGQEVHVMALTDGTGSHPHSRNYPSARLAQLRAEELRHAVSMLGVAPQFVSFLGERDGAAPRFGPRLHRLSRQICSYMHHHGITNICTTWEHDPHRDHVAACRIARHAAAVSGARLFRYVVWGWVLPAQKWLPSEPVRGVRIDIAPHRAAKRRAIDCHASQASGLIDDDPSGFRLPPDLLQRLGDRYEVLLCD